MNRLLRLLILTAICLLVVRTASADSVRITSGSITSTADGKAAHSHL